MRSQRRAAEAGRQPRHDRLGRRCIHCHLRSAIGDDALGQLVIVPDGAPGAVVAAYGVDHADRFELTAILTPRIRTRLLPIGRSRLVRRRLDCG